MSDIVYKNFSFSTPFLGGFRALKIPVLDPDGNSVWPEVFSPGRIETMRQSVGQRHFSAQMLLEFVPPDRIRLDPGGLKIYESGFDLHSARLNGQLITGVSMYWDPSSGRRKSDDSVCVLIYRDDHNRNVFIHDILYMNVDDNDTHPLMHQCEMVLDFMMQHNIRRISIETNGIGNALPEIMRDAASNRGANIYVHKIINTRNKSDRILDAIEPLLSSGHLYAHAHLASTPLFSEMLGWSPMGGVGHDDGLDAVAGAISCPPITVHPLGSTARTYSANTNFQI